jgi:nitroreductase
MSRLSFVLPLVILLSAAAMAQELSPIVLPEPQMDGGKPLMQALKERASQRDFAPDPLPPQVLSNLLWAAWGINRPESGKRTAPSPKDRQEMDVYVALTGGLYLYKANENSLKPVVPGDLRALTGDQAFVGTAPLNLVYVSRGKADAVWSGIQAGLISENASLFCASEGLATVVRLSFKGEPLAKAMKLRSDQKIVLAQSVGYPRKR